MPSGARPATSAPAAAPAIALATHRAEAGWALVADWCESRGEAALPALPGTLERFSAEVPASAGVLARRLRAIDAVHRAMGLPPAEP